MKKYIIKGTLLLAAAVSIIACSKEKLDEKSVLPSGDEIFVDRSPEGEYLENTFRKPYNIKVNYGHDRNQYGVGRDALRNLYPPERASIIPAMEMVNKVWIESYVKIAGKQFVNDIRPIEFLLAGGPALNDDGTVTLGLATAGARVTLYDLDRVVSDVPSAKQFIHTIQHEYIHIINMKSEFNEKDFGAETVAGYTPTWYQHSTEDSQKIGFVTNYARSNIFEDFAETASYMLTHTTAEYQALLASVTPEAKSKIENKVAKVRDYFKQSFEVDFDKLCAVANSNAASSPLLNKGISSSNANRPSAFGLRKTEDGKEYVHQCQYHSFPEKESIHEYELTK